MFDSYFKHRRFEAVAAVPINAKFMHIGSIES
jgi:hypothetical protein